MLRVNAVALSCSDEGYTSLNGPGVLSALSGKSVAAAAPDGEEWNEDHCSTGLNSPGAPSTRSGMALIFLVLKN